MLWHEDFDDDHRCAALWADEGTWIVIVAVSLRIGVGADRLGFKQRPGELEVVVTGGVGEEPVMTDAVEAFR